MRGTVFTLPQGGHPYIILCDPTGGKLVVVNVSDAVKSASTCYLEVGDHPVITKRSAVLYFRAKLMDAITRQQLEESGARVFPGVLDEAVLQRIFAGAQEADDFTPKLLAYLN
jgi:hypothetical protein